MSPTPRSGKRKHRSRTTTPQQRRSVTRGTHPATTPGDFPLSTSDHRPPNTRRSTPHPTAPHGGANHPGHAHQATASTTGGANRAHGDRPGPGRVGRRAARPGTPGRSRSAGLADRRVDQLSACGVGIITGTLGNRLALATAARTGASALLTTRRRHAETVARVAELPEEP